MASRSLDAALELHGPLGAPAIEAVVGQPLNPASSGVARFNAILAGRLGVPIVAVADAAVADLRAPLLSLKASKLDRDELGAIERLVASSGARLSVFLHEYSALELEQRLIRRAERVLCGNAEVHASVCPLTESAELVWAPGMILDHRSLGHAEVSVFSFGMAHKIHTESFRRLRELLESSGRSYAVYVSNADHARALARDAELVRERMLELFPGRLFFLGNLSDVAVSNLLRRSTFFAAFFPSGARGNNTSVASALDHGAVVITNLDEHSPAELRHGENMLDIAQCTELPSDPVTLRRIGANARGTADGRSWDALIARIVKPAAAPPS